MESEDPPATGSELFTLGSLDPSEHHENQDSSRLHVSVPRVSYRQMGSLSGGVWERRSRRRVHEQLVNTLDLVECKQKTPLPSQI